MSCLITKVDASYALALAALHAQMFPQAAWDEKAFSGLLALPDSLALLHESGGFLLLRIVLDEAEILTFGTIEKRLGIGSALLIEGLNRLKQQGVNTLYLEVAARNTPARLFYDKFGFTLTGRRKAYYEDGDDALTMRLSC